MTGIPPLDVEAARSRGLTVESDVAELWRQHLEWARARNLAVAGGAPWRSLLDAIIRKRNAIAKRAIELEASAAAMTERRAAEGRLRRQEAENYRRGRVTLEAWLTGIQDGTYSAPQDMTAVHALAAFRPRLLDEDVGAYLMAALLQ